MSASCRKCKSEEYSNQIIISQECTGITGMPTNQSTLTSIDWLEFESRQLVEENGQMALRNVPLGLLQTCHEPIFGEHETSRL